MRVERPFTARVLDAEREPVTWRELPKVEEAAEINPPEELMENIGVVVPLTVTWKALPVCVVRVFRVKLLEVEEVAEIVRRDWVSAVEVPITN